MKLRNIYGVQNLKYFISVFFVCIELKSPGKGSTVSFKEGAIMGEAVRFFRGGSRIFRIGRLRVFINGGKKRGVKNYQEG